MNEFMLSVVCALAIRHCIYRSVDWHNIISLFAIRDLNRIGTKQSYFVDMTSCPFCNDEEEVETMFVLGIFSKSLLELLYVWPLYSQRHCKDER